jgi:prefoldin subunit 5
MATAPDITNVASQDWSKFDFTRWNLDGLNIDPQSAGLAGWVHDVNVTPQGPQKFAAGLTAVISAAQQSLQAQVTVVQGRISTIDAELNTRVTAIRGNISAIEERIRLAGVPAAAIADPTSFQVVAKVADQASQLGLSGLRVRLYDAQSPSVTLVSATTDRNGNAVLKLNRDQIDSVTKSGASLAAEVLTPAGKSVFTGGAVPTPKLNGTGSVLASLAASADLAPSLTAASSAIAQEKALLSGATAKVTALQTRYQQLKSDLQQELQDLQAMIASLQPSAAT